MQDSPAPQLAALAPTNNFPINVPQVNSIPYYNPNEINFSSACNGNKPCTNPTTPFPPPVDALSTSPTNDLTVSTMNFFNRTDAQPLTTTTTTSSLSPPMGVLFASSASAPFVQQSTDNNNNNNNVNNSYYAPQTEQQKLQQQ